MNFNPADLMKTLQNMQSSMKDMQEKLKDIKVEGSAGGDMVKLTLNGKMEMLDITLSPECVDPRDIVMLQDIIKAAHNDAMSKLQEQLKSQMAGGMPGFPGMGV